MPLTGSNAETLARTTSVPPSSDGPLAVTDVVVPFPITDKPNSEM